MPKQTVISDLPSNEKSVHIEIKGETTGATWKGDFRIVRMPTIGMITRANIIQTRLSGDLATVDPSVRTIHNMLAQCQTRIIDAPTWWWEHNEGQELLDINVLGELYKQLELAEREYKEEVWGPVKEDKKKDEKKSTEKTEKQE